MNFKFFTRTLSRKWSMQYHKPNIQENEFQSLFSDYMAKSLLGREDKKHYLAFLLSSILEKEIKTEDLIFYKNEIGTDEISKIAFQCDITVFYQNQLFILEFNDSSDLFFAIRNIIYLFLIFYQFLKGKREKKITKINQVFLINFNNFLNLDHLVLKEEFHYRNPSNLLITKKLKTLEIYLPIALKKYYNDGIKKEELSKLEKLIIASSIGKIEEARIFLEGEDEIMCIIDDLFKLSQTVDAKNYYHSMEDAKTESYLKGENRGRKEGKKEGISIGTKQGIKTEKINTAKRMKEEGLSIDLIANITSLSKQTIINL